MGRNGMEWNGMESTWWPARGWGGVAKGSGD